MRGAVIFLTVMGCGAPEGLRPPTPQRDGSSDVVTLSIIGTNDLHGALLPLPYLAGHLDNLRAAHGERGAVLPIDGGDMFQGTLASNETEGEPVVTAYGLMGYVAAAVGNHEFDFGPVGPRATPLTREDDPRGALKARALQASFPLLMGNVLDAASGRRAHWPNMPSTAFIEAAGVKVGIIGVTTESTPNTTMAANFAGLAMEPPAVTINREGQALRDAGATVIVVAAHLGGRCEDLKHPNDLSTCDRKEEVFRVVENLTPGLVDVIVAGHTHQAMAHRVRDIAVIESYASGRAFGRVDLRVKRGGHVVASTIFPPYEICPGWDPKSNESCQPPPYEGRPVVPNAEVTAQVQLALARTRPKEQQSLGVVLTTPITRSYDTESALGNWFVDLMLAADPKAQVAVTNGGGLRADIPAGDLTYGKLYEAMPFDNRLTRVTLTGSQLRQMVRANLASSGGMLSWGGLAVQAACSAAGQLEVVLARAGKPIADGDTVTLVTSDFLATGESGVIGRLKLPTSKVQVKDVIIRDAMADVLRQRKGQVAASALLPTPQTRVVYPGVRPVKCGGANPTSGAKVRE